MYYHDYGFARKLARALGGDVIGPDQVLVPGIGHTRGDRSVSVRFDPQLPDGLWVHCFGRGNALTERDRVRQALGLADRRRAPREPVAKVAQPSPDAAARIRRARAVWAETQDCEFGLRVIASTEPKSPLFEGFAAEPG